MTPSYYTNFYYPKEVKPLPNYELSIVFDNGETRLFDVKPYLSERPWAPLKNVELFNSVYIDGSVCWAEDLDIAPEELWHNSIQWGT
jgi:hypothetical protein